MAAEMGGQLCTDRKNSIIYYNLSLPLLFNNLSSKTIQYAGVELARNYCISICGQQAGSALLSGVANLTRKLGSTRMGPKWKFIINFKYIFVLPLKPGHRKYQICPVGSQYSPILGQL